MLRTIIFVLMIIQIIAAAIWMFTTRFGDFFVLVGGVTVIYRAFTIINNGRGFLILLSEILLLGSIFKYYYEDEVVDWWLLIISLLLPFAKDGFKDYFDETPIKY